ncbi:hypothetical protein KR054_000844, partial [Drosophila jambulina]
AMETVCRVCMLSSAATLNIFDGKEKSGVSLADIVSQFMGLEVIRGDSFPETICPACLQDARTAFNRKQVQAEEEIQWIKEEVDDEDLLKEKVSRISDFKHEKPLSAENYYLHDIPVKQVPHSIHPAQPLFDFKVKNEPIDDDQPDEGTSVGPTEESNSEEDSNAFSCLVKEEEEIEEDKHSSDQSFKCPHCPSSYTRKSSLNVHLRKHTGERPYKCSHCAMAFTVKLQLREHIRIHTGERPFACDQCAKSFRKRTGLKIHKRTHLEVRPFQCSQCSKSFVRRYRLVDHALTHTGERPFQCPHCQKSYMTNAILQSHLAIHTELKPHQCS